MYLKMIEDANFDKSECAAMKLSQNLIFTFIQNIGSYVG